MGIVVFCTLLQEYKPWFVCSVYVTGCQKDLDQIRTSWIKTIHSSQTMILVRQRPGKFHRQFMPMEFISDLLILAQNMFGIDTSAINSDLAQLCIVITVSKVEDNSWKTHHNVP